MTVQSLATYPVHLGKRGSAQPQPEFTGQMDWYMAYAEATAADGLDGRLVAMHTFTAPWESWEMHPLGAEVVVCVSGELVLIQELPDGESKRLELGPGDYAVNPPGVWHTADAQGDVTVLFITAGQGTEHRPR